MAAGLLGDYNGNGIVDAADHTVWRDSLGSTTILPNDPSPGMVTQKDYVTWKTNFGATAGGGSALQSAVPEPATALLVLVRVGIAFLPGRRTACRAPTTR